MKNLNDMLVVEYLKTFDFVMKNNRTFFKKMYAYPPRTGDEKTIEQVVKEMATSKLDWAMSQIQGTLQKQLEPNLSTKSIG